MNSDTFHRLHTLRMENDAAKFRQEEMRPRFDALANRHEVGTAPRAVVSYQLFQTPPELAERLARALAITEGASLLEPSCGLGRLLDAAAVYQPSQIVAVENAVQCSAEIFRQNRKGVRLIQRDFLTLKPEEFEPFDFAIMNPPFHLRSDIAHIQHALRFLKAGGRLGALCMDTHHRESALRSMADTWEKIPAGVFKQEGTNTATVLLTITKK